MTLDLTVLNNDSCVDLLPLTPSVVSLSLHYLANRPLPLAPRTPNLQMHKSLLLIEVEFKCKFRTMQHSNVHMQIQVTYIARFVLAKKKPNKCVRFFSRGLHLKGGWGYEKTIARFFFASGPLQGMPGSLVASHQWHSTGVPAECHGNEGTHNDVEAHDRRYQETGGGSHKESAAADAGAEDAIVLVEVCGSRSRPGVGMAV